MEFALLIHGPERAWAELSEQDRTALYSAYLDFGRELREAGVTVVFGARLARPDAAKGDPREDGRPELGGMWILDLPSEEAALEWAGRLPAGPGDRVELRRCDRGRMSR
ncbi:YciI family protein [Nonomuraea spiralis]|uniref:YciI family protein n=1 Tax=Nonomuraea spiralis TaxID=46182 RepID=A0ABV5IFJ2_9ACTN|nr:YciI family protein [Nonomuraea spiralis]GGS71932.1 hypothetical protein GCM10010176_013670 [Nonomuraea spiralis]